MIQCNQEGTWSSDTWYLKIEYHLFIANYLLFWWWVKIKFWDKTEICHGELSSSNVAITIFSYDAARYLNSLREAEKALGSDNVCVCACVCVWAREREFVCEREGDKKGARDLEIFSSFLLSVGVRIAREVFTQKQFRPRPAHLPFSEISTLLHFKKFWQPSRG